MGFAEKSASPGEGIKPNGKIHYGLTAKETVKEVQEIKPLGFLIRKSVGAKSKTKARQMVGLKLYQAGKEFQNGAQNYGQYNSCQFQ